MQGGGESGWGVLWVEDDGAVEVSGVQVSIQGFGDEFVD